MAAVMIKLNTRARALATTAPLALVLGLLAAFTMGYILRPRGGNNHHQTENRLSPGAISAGPGSPTSLARVTSYSSATKSLTSAGHFLTAPMRNFLVPQTVHWPVTAVTGPRLLV